MTAKHALKTCEKISSSHGFICCEVQHICRHSDGSHSYGPRFSISVFRDGAMLDQFIDSTGFNELIPQIKKLLAAKP